MDTIDSSGVAVADGEPPGEGGILWRVITSLEQAVRQASDDELPTWLVILEHQVAMHLEPRMSVEEQSLLPRLRRNGHAEAVSQARAEHAALQALLRDDSLPLRERLGRFATLLRAHLLFEQQYESPGGAVATAGLATDCVKK
ncbi:hypothetical protein ABWL39_08575 [Chitinivorax sp. PXF-14]|uniref:hypothetical protein n=1 Tax=Chitinivorax sp. PXF-14 TaxID=3230488 RepID=UPI0034660851